MKQKKRIREKISNVLSDIKQIKKYGIIWFLMRHEILTTICSSLVGSAIGCLIILITILSTR